eukprot:CAMPEP_0196572034 /NCGR_PEP_ID=MMETSP1081-20130531/2160_1 /TAXON_ID=36882 /ORGANISM="Pyramimonas amylifera, Strain CCMP720" /LENGTH=155 /DNA_ID=CAMNT_0041889215 /DNA_START=92 /DNA_END=556 /DNA_ORIENTATION=+
MISSHLQQPLRCSGQLSLLFSGGKNSSLEITRAEAVKLVWAYADKHQLKHPEDGRRIICDPALRDVLGLRELSFGTLAAALTPHLSKLTNPTGRAVTQGFDKGMDEDEETVWASLGLTKFMLKTNALTVNGNGWLRPVPDGEPRILFTRTEALRW